MERPWKRFLMTACVVITAAVTTVAERGVPVPLPELRAVSSRLDGAVSTVLIEASEPVAYVTTQPDPLTVLVDLRNVNVDGIGNRAVAGPLPPVSAVRVEPATAGDGAPIARVRVSLSREAKYRVRSARNVIYVEVNRDAEPRAAVPAASAAPSAAALVPTNAPATNAVARSLRAVRAERRNGELAITLVGDGQLVASTVEEARDLPPRVLLDFQGVAPGSVPSLIAVNEGDVQRVRVATNSRTPLVTRVVIDLARKISYRVQEAGNELRVLFGGAAAAASGTPVAATPAVVSPEVVERIEPLPTNTHIAPAPPAAPAAPQAVAAMPAPATPAAAVLPAAPTAAMPPAVSGLQAQGGGSQRFTGPPVTLDFQGADLRAVLRTFAEISGLNIVIDPTISGSVDVALRDVPWDQALDIILKANKLGYVVEGTVVRIAPISVLAQEEEERRKLAEAQALAGELQVLTRALSYSKAQELVPIITRGALSQRGEVQVDTRTNTIIVKDLPDRLTAVAELVATLDKPQPQVEIEARIIQTNRDFAQKLGVEWGISGRVDPSLGNTTGLAFPNTGSLTGRVGGVQGPDGAPTGVDLGITGANSALGLALGSINGALNLDVALSAMERTGKLRLLSTPRVSTQNNVEAEMTQGIQIPIQTVANNTVTVTFKDAALTLKVTPQITASNTVILRITLENAAADFSRAINGIPPINTQRAVTSVLVSDGETTVIGGIYTSTEQVLNGRVPFLHRIPLLGWLFKNNETSDESRELLIFITPRITKGLM